MNSYEFILHNGIMFPNDDDHISSIKQEECSNFEQSEYYNEQFMTFIPYECSNLSVIIANILAIPEEQVDWLAVNNPIEFDKLMIKAKRKLNREKAKNKIIVKVEEPIVVAEPLKKSKRGRKPHKNVEKSYLMGDSDSDKCCDRKVVQMIRNRISAQNSRDRKKAYLKELENSTNYFKDENVILRQQIEQMEQRNNEIMMQNEQVQKCVNIFMGLCKKSKNKTLLDIGQQLQQIQEDSDTNPNEVMPNSKKIKQQ